MNQKQEQKFIDEIYSHLNKPDIQKLLSNRELQCFYYILHGKTAKQISKILKLSTRTIECYIAKMKKKLNLKCVSEVFDYAYNNELITTSTPLNKVFELTHEKLKQVESE